MPVFGADGNPVTGSSGDPAVRLEHHVVGTFALRSAQILNMGDRLSEAALYRADKILASINYANEDALVEALSALGGEGRAKAWKDLRSAWELIAEARPLCQETQEFLEAENLKNLVAWGNDWRAPVQFRCGIDIAGRAWFENNHHRRRCTSRPRYHRCLKETISHLPIHSLKRLAHAFRGLIFNTKFNATPCDPNASAP